MVIDVMSVVGGIDFDVMQVDVYYFVLQKNFGFDGGLWFVVVFFVVIECIECIVVFGCYIFEFLSLKNVVDNLWFNQIFNILVLMILYLFDSQF